MRKWNSDIVVYRLFAIDLTCEKLYNALVSSEAV